MSSLICLILIKQVIYIIMILGLLNVRELTTLCSQFVKEIEQSDARIIIE